MPSISAPKLGAQSTRLKLPADLLGEKGQCLLPVPVVLSVLVDLPAVRDALVDLETGSHLKAGSARWWQCHRCELPQGSRWLCLSRRTIQQVKQSLVLRGVLDALLRGFISLPATLT